MDTDFVPPPMTPAQRRRTLAMRRWLPEERRIVHRGLLGRFTIAVEPAAIAVLFAWFAYRLAFDGPPWARHENWIFSLVFLPGAAAF
ncbi:MAG TPA: hypothetical protein VEJ20_09530, partial [Candidatus Eremiobacteraceae bacterium]|nr:hypothetical protein [Candidatus Eremiobacteraceae bacterium]